MPSQGRGPEAALIGEHGPPLSDTKAAGSQPALLRKHSSKQYDQESRRSSNHLITTDEDNGFVTKLFLVGAPAREAHSSESAISKGHSNSKSTSTNAQ